MEAPPAESLDLGDDPIEVICRPVKTPSKDAIRIGRIEPVAALPKARGGYFPAPVNMNPIPPASPEDARPSVRDLLAQHASAVEAVREPLSADPLYRPELHDDLWILRFCLSHKKVSDALAAARGALLYRHKHNLDAEDVRLRRWPDPSVSNPRFTKFWACVSEGASTQTGAGTLDLRCPFRCSLILGSSSRVDSGARAARPPPRDRIFYRTRRHGSIGLVHEPHAGAISRRPHRLHRMELSAPGFDYAAHGAPHKVYSLDGPDGIVLCQDASRPRPARCRQLPLHRRLLPPAPTGR